MSRTSKCSNPTHLDSFRNTKASKSPSLKSLSQPSPLSEQQVMLFWHLGTLLLGMAARIEWQSLPAKPRRRLRPLLTQLHDALGKAQRGIAIKGAPEEESEEELPL